MTLSSDLSRSLTDERECDREALHLLAAIQDHGSLLAFTWPDQRVQMVSENSQTHLGLSPTDLLGTRLEQLIGRELTQVLTPIINSYPWEVPGLPLDRRPQINGRTFDAFLYKSEGLFVLELEEFKPSFAAPDLDVESEQILREYMLQSKALTSIEELGLLVCQTFRKITGLDRVMIYKFLPPSWHGQVIAEDRVTHAHSYLGHRFPSSDIPRPARELYLRNQVRLIPNAEAGRAKLVPQKNPLTQQTVDLTDSRLRAVSSIHLQYLKNMGVGASFSVAINDKNNLWGLITCHHLKPFYISQAKRTTCEIVAHAFSIQAPLLEQAAADVERLLFERRLRQVLESLRQSADPLADFFKLHITVSETFAAGGIALVDDEVRDFAGLTPAKRDLAVLGQALRDQMREENQPFMAIESLAEINPEWVRFKDFASGVLAVLLPELKNSVFLILRRERVRTITWGGDPRKQLQKRTFQGDINPRSSFEAWEETIKNRSAPWTDFEIDGASFMRDVVFQGLVKKQLLIQELSQRLTPVQSSGR